MSARVAHRYQWVVPASDYGAVEIKLLDDRSVVFNASPPHGNWNYAFDPDSKLGTYWLTFHHAGDAHKVKEHVMHQIPETEGFMSEVAMGSWRALMLKIR